MEQTDRLYPFEKDMILNVIYDTLDRLGARVESSNSVQGVIRFQTQEGFRALMNVEPSFPQGSTRITIGSEADDLERGFGDALLDEVNSTIEASGARRDLT